MNNGEFEFKIVGHDQNGQPLYQKVPITSNDPSIQTQALSANPSVQISKRRGHYDYMSPELIELRHNRSVEQYPDLGLEDSDCEFVIREVNRSPVGVIAIWAIDVLVIIGFLAFWIMMFYNQDKLISTATGEPIISFSVLSVAILAFAIIASLLTWVMVGVYKANRIIMTSERVIQHIAKGLFDRKTQSVDYNNIEDVSYHKLGIIQSILDLGNVKMSTIGEESTYRLTMVYDPEEVSSELNYIVQAIKSGNKLPDLD